MPPHLPELLAVTFVAAFAQAVSGFGFAVVATPFYALYLGTVSGVQLAVILGGAFSAFMACRLRRAVDWARLGRLVPASLPGVAVGDLLFIRLDKASLLSLMGWIILAFSAGLVVERCWRRRAFAGSLTGGRVTECLVGCVAGATTALVAMPGPPVLIFLLLGRERQERLRATLAAFFVPCYAIVLALQVRQDGIPEGIWLDAFILLLVGVVGLRVGGWTAPRVSELVFFVLAIALLTVAGLRSAGVAALAW